MDRAAVLIIQVDTFFVPRLANPITAVDHLIEFSGQLARFMVFNFGSLFGHRSGAHGTHKLVDGETHLLRLATEGICFAAIERGVISTISLP